MSDGQRTRRRFLADLLFLGGALSAGAFLTQTEAQAPGVTPTPASTPVTPPTNAPVVRGQYVAPASPDGDMAIPHASPTCAPVVEGEPKPPEPAIEGKVTVQPLPKEVPLAGVPAPPRE